MSAPCRYLPGTACDRASCSRDACPGPVDLDAPDDRGDQRRRAQQAEREVPTGRTDSCGEGREEVKTMLHGRPKAPVDNCPRCGKGPRKLMRSQFLKDETERACKYCIRAATKAAKAKKPEALPKPPKPASAPAKPAAPKPPGPEPIVQWRPAGASSAAFVPLTARALADALQAERVVLRVTCRTAASVLAVVRAAESDQDVAIGTARG